MDAGTLRASFADAERRPFWLASPAAPEPAARLEGEHEADLLVVGGGLTGLWAALLAREEDPGREVILVEGERIAFGASGRNAVFAVGYTGLGVAASRFGARVALDLVDGLDTERTRLAMVRTKPIPFPPEPLRWAGIALTRRALARADRRAGRRGPWLRTLDRLGMGYDS
jgi:monoamine oxidase